MFEGFRVRKHYTVKVQGGRFSELELKHITSDFCVLTVRDFFSAFTLSLFSMVCKSVCSLEGRERSSANSIFFTVYQ
jgi:hypothetical protein